MSEITSTSWSEINNRVQQLNPALFEVIESSPELKSHDLKVFKYNYGELVGDEAFFYEPKSSGDKHQLIPFSMILNNFFEMPLTIEGKNIPWKMYKPGSLFPYTRFLPSNRAYEPSNQLSMYAGSRNAFFLINKIADKKWHKLLCNKYKIDTPPPSALDEQFRVFSALVDSCTPDWSADLLVFPEEFFRAAQVNLDFRELIFNISHEDKLFRRNIHAYEVLLSKLFARVPDITSAFIRDIIKEILYIACGDIPAYFPVACENYAPVEFLTEAYIEGFRSKSCPILMVSDFFSPFKDDRYGYFSLNYLDYLDKPKKIPSQAQLIKDTIKGLEIIAKEILSSGFSEEAIFFNSAKNLLVEALIKGDGSIDYNLKKDKYIDKLTNNNPLPLPTNSTFLSSCIQLSYNNYDD